MGTRKPDWARKQYVKRIGETSFTSYESQSAVNKIAADAVEMAFSGTYEPLVVFYRGSTLFVYRIAQDGWTYQIIRGTGAGEGVVQPLRGFVGGRQGEPRDKVLAFALGHFAQWVANVELDPMEYVPFFLQDSSQRREFKAWMLWQKRYLCASKLVDDDNLAWRLAGNDPSLKGEERALLDKIELK